jgi:hypothetical protein
MQPLRSRGLVKKIQLVLFQMVELIFFSSKFSGFCYMMMIALKSLIKVEWVLFQMIDIQRLWKIQWVQFLLQMIALKVFMKIPWALLQMMASKDRLKIQCVLFQMMAFKRPIEDSMCFFA